MKYLFFVSLTIVILLSCRKGPINPAPVPTAPDTRTYQERLADTLYKLASQIYYWNTQLPDSATFKPLGYARTDTIAGLKAELLALTRNAINPATGKPYEQYVTYQNGINTDVNSVAKFSYLSLTSDLYGGGTASHINSDEGYGAELNMTLDGKENELGLTLGFARVSYLANTPRAMTSSRQDSIVALVRIVTNGSPAWRAGIRRGDLISKFNGNSWNYSANFNQISNALDGNSLSLTSYDPISQKDTTVSFDKTVYTFNPVYKDTLLTIGSRKIAYVAYKSFTDDNNTRPALSEAFNKFGGATDLVIDLRYNGGGRVSAAAYFANLVLPSSASGGVLFKEIHNTMMQNKQATILKTQPVYLNNVKQSYSYFDVNYSIASSTTTVKKTGSFNSAGTLKTVYFIVSDNSASASELLINSLKPYFSDGVYLINAPFSATDDPNYTYGKPVGFYEMRIGKYSVYLSNYESKNKNDEGGYYRGLPTNVASNDDIRYDLGNPNEAAFLTAIRRITGNNSYQPAASTVPRSVVSTATGANSSVVAAVGEPTKIFDMVSTPRL